MLSVSLRLVALASLLAWWAGGARLDAQATNAGHHCDPAVPQDFGNQLGYQERGDRCEGLYKPRVSSTAFSVVAFGAGQQQVSPPAAAQISVGTSPTEVWLTAASSSRALPYRMDARLPPMRGSFTWPTQLVQRVGLKGSDIGLVATVERQVFGRKRQVLVAVSCCDGRVETLGSARSSRELRLRLGQDFSKAWWTLARVGELADKRDVVATSKLGGVLSAERTVAISLDLSSGTCFRLELGGTPENGLASLIREHFICELEP